MENKLENKQNNQISIEIQQQIRMLNLRINDMMTQLNNTLKVLIEENLALRVENAKLAPVNPQRSESHSDKPVKKL